VKLFMRVVGVPGWMLGVMRILPMWKKMRAVAHTLPYDAAALSGFVPPADRLGSIRVPTLLVYGDKTPPSLQDGTQAAAKLVPKAELRVLPKQSHNLKPASIVPTLVEFTSKHVALSSPKPVVAARRSA
jgi:pimeloyl-ACP methyl ester carboxylesterase